jgi:hypothetical protein
LSPLCFFHLWTPIVVSFRNSFFRSYLLTSKSTPELKMARTTRSSQNSNKSSPPATKAGNKRSAAASYSPPAKRGRPSQKAKPEKVQKTIEEILPEATDAEKDQKTIDETMKDVDDVEDDKDVAKQINGTKEDISEHKDESSPAAVLPNAEPQVADEENRDAKMQMAEGDQEGGEGKEENGIKNAKSAFDEVKADEGEAKEAALAEQDEKADKITSNNDSSIQDADRAAGMPSSILEKGIIYFFFRGRVGIEDPQGIEDVARSYIVLRPLPIGAKLGEGPLEDSGKARLLALPKKMLPKSKQDRFLMFVEKPTAFIKDLRDQFASNDYATKTSG